ncbi:unnamed protein product [Hermetia illucens]|uniref:Uncharacterized protein n=1 Tax=Hermetia illucens TaxID=343691 RepID=A0A7R8UKC6_HERIL|nr:protein downstream neighbor of son homolog [Hermetia illucens]CAD7082457.1 unnamed protein product [Hermetia illucens]
MAANSIITDKAKSQKWKTPNEILKLQRLQQKKKALQARLSRSQTQNTQNEAKSEAVPSQKRKNPFLKNSNENAKRPKIEPESPPHNEDTVFQLIQQTEAPKPPPKRQFDIFNNYEEQEETEIEEQKFNPHLAIDWSIKSRLRIFCKESLPETSLKTSQEASGLTSFVRCIDPSDSSTGLDISPSARFYQSALYWQHPYLPWMTLFPRNSKSNNGPIVGEVERASLLKDWTESFRGLFQLVRARQCPYFYVCANTFTVLFRAAGICGRVETHALLSPSTRGMRNALRQEEIEFTQPLKKDANLNRSGEGNSSFSNPSDDGTQESTTDLPEQDDDDLDDDKWLESLGVDAKEIKKINALNSRLLLNKESAEDASDNSLVLIEGIECQAFFNFLLNAKSTIATVGRLAGVPPTLLAPVAFPGATMRSLQTRSTKVRMDGTDYSSVELKGVILPHVLQYQCNLLAEMRDSFSATMAVNTNTLAFCKASKIIAEEVAKENKTSDQVFGKENLSDCGLQSKILDSMCRVGTDAVDIIERMCYCKEQGGYSWS